MASDEELIKKTLKGDLEAFEEIVNRYFQPLTRHAHKYTRDDDEAQDAAQEALVSAYKNLRHFDTRRTFKPWVYKITTNLCLDDLRKNSKTLPLTIDVEDASSRSSEEVFFSKTQKAELLTAVQTLPRKYKLPIVGFYFDDRSYLEISHLLKVPIATVKTHLRRGKLLLRQMLLKRRTP